MARLSPRLLEAPRSGIRALMDAAWAHDGPVNHLEVGEPDFATPPHIVAAFVSAAEVGHTRYTPNAGIAPLRSAISLKLAARNSITVTPDQIIVTVGATEALLLAVRAIASTGNDVLIPSPGWPNYEMFATLAGARPVRYRLRPSDGYALNVEELERVCTDQTTAIILNTPSNPLGVVHSRDELLAIGDWAERRGLWLIVDECYDAITFENSFVSAASLLGVESTITIHSFSKTYAMTGLRLGYASGPSPAINLMIKMQESAVACVNAPTQYAGIAALEGDQSCVTTMVSAYRTRRDAAVLAARRAELDVLVPRGAFYLWLSDSRITTTTALDLLAVSGVAVAPGSAFAPEATDSVRLSLASTLPNILTGIEALSELLTRRY